MLNSAIARLGLTLSLLGALSLPVSANPQQTRIVSSAGFNQSIVLPESTALLISFPRDVIVDVGQHEDYPITLPLMQDVRLPNGDLLIPANTPISVTIKPYKDGAMLVADSIIINGQVISVTAQSAKLPGRTITNISAQQMARQNSALAGNLATSILGAAGADLSLLQRGGFGGAAIGILSGIGSPDDVRIVEIGAGSVHILKLNASTELVSR